MYRGIDVSQWQGEIDFNKVKNTGIKFAIIRTGYGRGGDDQIDPKFYANIQKAKLAGISVGAYHYSYAESVEDAAAEAKFCLEIIKSSGISLDLPVYFDIEDESIASKHNKDIRTNMCIAFCSEIEKAGYWAGVYANKNWFDNYLNYKELVAKYTLWLAHYGIDSPSLDCDIWQYTSSGRVDGINGNVDMNYMYREIIDEIKNSSNKINETTEISYTVVEGDSLSSIASKYNMSWQVIAAVNNIVNPDLIYAGQVIKIPIFTNGKTYTVKSGDTLWDIAQNQFGDGSRYSQIKSLNGLTSDTIYPGQSLKIPD